MCNVCACYVVGDFFFSSRRRHTRCALVTGVQTCALPISPGGEINPVVMAAAHIGGVDEIWRVGGAQAIAALAYGTSRIAPVDEIGRASCRERVCQYV